MRIKDAKTTFVSTSCALTQKNALGFTSIMNRLNVAISTAKFGLIIFGDFLNFQHHENKG